MSLKIGTNLTALEAASNLRKVDQAESKEYSKLSSGKRIFNFSEDPAGAAIAQELKAQNRSLRQAVRNVNDGISMVQTAEGGLTEISNILVRMRELNVQAASDTVNDSERELLNLEYQQLLEEVDRISETTYFNRRPLLSSSSDNGVLNIQAGPFSEESNIIPFDADSTDASSDGIGISRTSILERPDALENFEYIDEAIDKVSSYRASLGAVQNRLATSVNNLETQSINIDAARSNIEDVDVADSSAQIASLNVRKQAAIAALAQANNLPKSALKLLY